MPDKVFGILLLTHADGRQQVTSCISHRFSLSSDVVAVPC